LLLESVRYRTDTAASGWHRALVNSETFLSFVSLFAVTDICLK
jgi:hypothetical protein